MINWEELYELHELLRPVPTEVACPPPGSGTYSWSVRRASASGERASARAIGGADWTASGGPATVAGVIEWLGI